MLKKIEGQDLNCNGWFGRQLTYGVIDWLIEWSTFFRPDPRFISFQKDGSVGIRLTGNNSPNPMLYFRQRYRIEIHKIN